MNHAELVIRAERYLKNVLNCGVVFTELSTRSREIPDAIGFLTTKSILIECKTSVGDFRADAKKRFRQKPGQGVGKFRFYFCEKGLLTPEDMPAGWGLITVSNGTARRVHGPRGRTNKWRAQKEWVHTYSRAGERLMMLSALRRLELRGHLDSIYEPAPKRQAA
jgi:hypothetical protein